MRGQRNRSNLALRVIEVHLALFVVLVILGISGFRFPGIGGEPHDGRDLTEIAVMNLEVMTIELEVLGVDWRSIEIKGKTLSDIERLYLAIQSNRETKPGIAGIPENLIVDTDRDGLPSVHDAWGHELTFVPADTAVPGGPAQPAFYFMSPGPDGQPETTEDNLYSSSTIDIR